MNHKCQCEQLRAEVQRLTGLLAIYRSEVEYGDDEMNYPGDAETADTDEP